MHVFHVGADQCVELPGLPEAMPADGFVWVACQRSAFAQQIVDLQSALQRLTGDSLVDLHVSDLLNASLPSHHDSTSSYELLVFRRLVAAADPPALTLPVMETSAVGFAVFDRLLLSVHHADCTVREHFAQRLLGRNGVVDPRATARLPTGTADLMLRMVNHMVDSYLELRRVLTRQLGALQSQLLNPKSRFTDWHQLLDARNALNLLEDTCEDQHGAVAEWIEALDEWPSEADEAARRERELLRVRSRDVLEHVQRVLGHVRRLEESAEAAVQMHFSALGHRTNAIMRTLTVLTAIFLPLNLITGFFGMNFDSLPLIHARTGVWVALALMVAIGLGLGLYFWRKRYIGSR